MRSRPEKVEETILNFLEQIEEEYGPQEVLYIVGIAVANQLERIADAVEQLGKDNGRTQRGN